MPEGTTEEVQPVTPEEFKAEIDRLELLIKQHIEAQEKQTLEASEKEQEHEELQAKNIESNQKQIEASQKQIGENNEQIKTLSQNVTDLKESVQQASSVDPTTNTYTVQISQDQIEKLKLRETKYQEMTVIYVSILIGLILGYIGVKGLFGRWNTAK